MNWYVGPLSDVSALSFISPARIEHASSRVGALMLSRWKKSASPGWVWIFDWAAEPDRASAPSATPSGPVDLDDLADPAEPDQVASG